MIQQVYQTHYPQLRLIVYGGLRHLSDVTEWPESRNSYLFVFLGKIIGNMEEIFSNLVITSLLVITSWLWVCRWY